MNNDTLSTGCGLVALAVFNSESIDLKTIDKLRLANIVAGGIHSWLDSGMRIDNYLYALNVDVNLIEQQMGAPIASLIEKEHGIL